MVVCSSNSLATRWGTRNLIYLLVFILLWLLLTIVFLIFLLFFSTQSLLSSSSPNKSNGNGFYRHSWTCLGWIKNEVNSVWVMFWYYWAYTVAIDKRLLTNDKLITKSKKELQRDQWTKVRSNITNSTTYQKLTSDNSKRRIFRKWH